MHILFICGREEGYTRNQVLLRAFQRFAKVTQITDNNPKKSITRRSIEVLYRALPALLREKYDLVFVGFYGHLLMLPVGLLARSPIIFDAFISTYDTLISDRQVAKGRSFVGALSYALDWAACRLADHILLDTPQHVAYFVKTFHLPERKFTALPVGCNEDIFYPRLQLEKSKVTQVLYYCSYLPLHGVRVVIEAAKILKEAPFCFRLIGSGPELAGVQKLAKNYSLNNVIFHPQVPLERLAVEIAKADISLGGHFNTSEKAQRVIPGKIFQIMACARPVIAADSPANRSLLTDGETAILCHPGSPEALADALQLLRADNHLRQRVAAGGRAVYEEKCSEDAITACLRSLIGQVIR